ncbi:MAG TPA: TrpB-like pyridoxal phosphate-dependent enzyme [Hyphomicrobiaceae bacterium]|jgi:tryptophan synthase beta chain|nr:TrpB-like pyridoxal phosphate-dependent enzyme [Hyphomicrobiaceae bacterium]
MSIQAPATATRIQLDEHEMPTRWYNIQADLPFPGSPPLHPGTKQPVGPQDLAPLFPMELIKQEVSTERYIDIPQPIQEALRLWRPTPLLRAIRLERALKTTAKIYYKYEGGSPPGSHKPNTAVAQAFYNKAEGTRRLTTETGAGQWGSALAFATKLFELECMVYMVRISYEQKPYRKSMMHVWGAEVVPSPSDRTQAGQRIRAEDPESTGSLGIAISEAIEDAATKDDTKYSLGSVLNHVLMHQTIIGEEALLQMERAGAMPDIVVGCVGGGSNFSGLAFPFLKDRLQGRTKTRFLAVEPAAAPSITRGKYAYDFGDTVGMTPLLEMYTLGHRFVPEGIHAGGLRYHGMAPLVSALAKHGFIEAVAYPQRSVFDAAVQFARTEGTIPAPETAHAIRAVIDEAVKARESGQSPVILFNLSGHGLLDLAAYDSYFAGTMSDVTLSESRIKELVAAL